MSDVKMQLSYARALHRKLGSEADVTPREKEAAQDALRNMLESKFPMVAITDPIPVVRAGELGERKRILTKNKEVWFMGCHSDVGGGNDLNGQASLANIPFRWMLREAVQCGIKLDAKGVALQPALYDTALVRERKLVPAELTRLLQEEMRGEVFEEETERRIAMLIKLHLPPSRLLEVVEMAAASDTDLRITDSGEEDGRAADTTDPPLPVTAEASPGAAVTTSPRGIMREEEAPLGLDALMNPKESLTVWWYPLELTLLQTRKYAGWTGTDKDVWRLNLGRPRQIVHGQMIHRSVLKRFLHHYPTPPPADSVPGDYQIGPHTIIGPTAQPPSIRTETSDEAMEGTGRPTIGIRLSLASSRPESQEGREAHRVAGDATPVSICQKDQTIPRVEKQKKIRRTGEASVRQKDGYLQPKAMLPADWHVDWTGLRRDEGGPNVVWEL